MLFYTALEMREVGVEDNWHENYHWHENDNDAGALF
jgi:hypothetical protein